MKQLIYRFLLFAVITALLIAAPAAGAVKAAPELSDSSINAPLIQVPAPNTGLQRIRFARGTTNALVSGDLPARSRARYVLRAMAGQLMDVTLTAPQGALLFVTNASGRPLVPKTGSSSAFRGYLPRNGDYIIEVASAEQAISYSVYVSIPQRISFERGATSATLEGHVGAHQSHDYILRAGAGQIMEINVTPDSSLQLIIFGVDGTVLRSGMGEGTSFRGELPLSQDYIVTLRAGDKEVFYTINVIIPRRITFARGAVSATLRSTAKANRSQYYVLRALQGQTMQVEAVSARPVQLIIYGADGTVLRSGMGEGSSFTGVLPSTQDYILVVRAGPVATTYTLKVTIR